VQIFKENNHFILPDIKNKIAPPFFCKVLQTSSLYGIKARWGKCGFSPS
jgi:hypothetical protein